ncbi:hypothetical protein [Vitreimonas sp.]|uniref:hypothetical protein n=1 Tax=Vitreimonas sp. TaxID=3069702 RepID=UPI002ED9699B
MRAFDRAVAALALRAMPTKPPAHEKRLVPALDDARQAQLDRAAISQQRAALIASLWPEPTRQCIAPPVFMQFAAPATFGLIFRFGAPQRVDARALQARLDAAFGAAKAPPAAETAKAA